MYQYQFCYDVHLRVSEKLECVLEYLLRLYLLYQQYFIHALRFIPNRQLCQDPQYWMDHERQDLQIRQYRRKYHPNYNHFQITTQTHLISIYYIKGHYQESLKLISSIYQHCSHGRLCSLFIPVVIHHPFYTS